jgi:hypothetical protein
MLYAADMVACRVPTWTGESATIKDQGSRIKDQGSRIKDQGHIRGGRGQRDETAGAVDRVSLACGFGHGSPTEVGASAVLLREWSAPGRTASSGPWRPNWCRRLRLRMTWRECGRLVPVGTRSQPVSDDFRARQAKGPTFSLDVFALGRFVTCRWVGRSATFQERVMQSARVWSLRRCATYLGAVGAPKPTRPLVRHTRRRPR